MEKRHFSRVDYHVHAVMTCDGETFTADVENLSLHGVLVRSGRAIPMGKQIEMTISLSGITPPVEIQLCGQLVRAQGDLLGIKFDRIDLDSFVHLRNIVSICKGDADSVMDEFMDFVGASLHASEEPAKG